MFAIYRKDMGYFSLIDYLRYENMLKDAQNNIYGPDIFFYHMC